MGDRKKLDDISIKWQLMTICAILVIVPVLILGVVGYNIIKTETSADIEDRLQEQAQIIAQDAKTLYDIAQGKVTADLNVARNFLHEGGQVYLDESETTSFAAIDQVSKSEKTVTVPAMKVGGEGIAFNYNIVDDVQNVVGGTATVFQVIPGGLLRISTNVLKIDGERAVGTYIPSSSPVYESVMKGETFYGRAFVVNAWYLTAYEPIKDSSGEVIGVLYVGVKEDDFQGEFKSKLSELVVGKTGYVYILNKEGDYVLSLGGKRDGENIWEAKDADGASFIQEIIGKAQGLNDGETFVQYYSWKNEGESSSRLKLAGVSYVPEWDWVIGSSAYQEDFFDGLNRVKNNSIVIALIAMIVGSLVAYLFAMRIGGSLAKLVKKMNMVAEGDLRVTAERGFGKNEIGQISNAFSIMTDNLKQLIGSVKTNAGSTVIATEQLASSAEEVNASMEQVSSSMQDVSKGAQTVASSSVSAQEASNKTKVSAEEGGKLATEISSKMGVISTTTKEGADKIATLGEKSQEIGNIIETINNISEQTNLLALNAAIEAARAGDAGRGFAVVADEVRKLAEESRKATEQISGLIGGIQGEIKQSVTSMNKTNKEVESGSKTVQDALSSFETIPQLIGGVNTSLSEMAAVAQQNAAGSEEVSSSVQEVTSSMQQVSSAAQQLSAGADELKTLISKFKLLESSKEPIKNAKKLVVDSDDKASKDKEK